MHQRKRVAQTGEYLRIENFFLSQPAQSAGQGEQMPGEIAAIDTGDVERDQWPQGARLIPVVEMPAMPFQPMQGIDGRLRPLEQAA